MISSPAPGISGIFQVFGKHHVARRIREHPQRAGHQHGRHDGQTIQAVGEVHCIGETHDPEVGDHHEAHADQRQRDGLEHRDVKRDRRRDVGGVVQEQAGRQAEDRLQQILPARFQPIRVATHDLDPVVVPADRTEADHHRQHQPHIAITQVAPQQHRQGDGEQDQRAAHGRRAGLGKKCVCGPSWRIGWPPLNWASLRITAGPIHNDRNSAVNAAKNAAEGQIVEQPEQALQLLQPTGQLKQHGMRPPPMRAAR